MLRPPQASLPTLLQSQLQKVMPQVGQVAIVVLLQSPSLHFVFKFADLCAIAVEEVSAGLQLVAMLSTK